MVTYAAAVMADGPIAYWRLGETTGNAADTSGFGHVGTYVGSITRGQAGATYSEINGSITLPASPSSYVSVADTATLRTPVGNSWSMEAWIRPTAPSGFQDVLRKDGAGGAYFIRLNGTTLGSLWAMPAGANAQLSGGTVTAGLWQHVVATYDGAFIRHYINGAQVASVAETRTLTFNTALLVLGIQGTGGGEQFVGGLDEIVIYNYALPAARVLAHYLTGAAPAPTTSTIAAASAPPATVEVAFTATPLASSPTWVDITEYCRDVAIRRGRDFELARYPTGTATIVVDNRDRRFDPGYVYGSYYPYVIPGRRIRVRAGSNIIGNASFETDLAGYLSFAATATRVTTQAYMGAASVQITTTNATAAGLGRAGQAADLVPLPVIVGTTYTFSLYAKRATAGSTTMIARIQWWTAANTLISQSDSMVTLSSVEWARFSVTGTAPATAAYVRLWFYTAAASGVFDFYTDAWQFEVGAVARIWHESIGSLYDGYVEAWPQDWDPPSESRSALEAADGFKMLELRKLPGGYPQLVLSHSPAGYWRLGDIAPSTIAEDASTYANDGTYVPAHPGSTTTALRSDSDAAVDLNGTTEYVQITDIAAYAFSAAMTAEAWVKFTSAGQAPIIERRTNPGNIGGFYLYGGFPAAGNIIFQVYVGGVWVGPGYAGPVNNGLWHHVVGTYDGANVRLYVDGALAAGPTALTGTINNPASPVFRIGSSAVSATFFPGQIDEVAVYPTALSAAQVAAHYAAGSGNFPAQTSPQRVSAVLDAVRWPSGQRITYGGTEPVQASALTNVTALQHLQDVADAEAGRVFVDSSGRVRFDGRDVFFTPPFTDTEATFGDNPLAADELRYTDLQAAYDDTQVWNDVRLTRAGGVEQVAQDAESIDAYGQRGLQTSNMLNTTDNNMLSLAQYRLSQYKQPLLRFTTLAIRPGIEARMWEQVLVRDIADRVRIGRTPQGIGPPIAFDCWIEGIEHDIRPGFWESRWRLSRADAQTYWLLGDAAYSLLGETTWLAF